MGNFRRSGSEEPATPDHCTRRHRAPGSRELPALFVLLTALLALPWGRAATQSRDAVPPGAPEIASPHGDLASGCESCHTADRWTTLRRPLAFSHATTGFPLEGRHRSVECKDCHRSLVFSHVASSCADCHRDVHESRHGMNCQDCHTPEFWTGRADALRQHAATGFPLRGMHALLECTRCHAAPAEASVAKLSSECVACHADDYAATQRPDHAAAGYSTRCDECHDASRTTWSGSGFDHTTTGFALSGAHRGLDCTVCHGSGGFPGVSASCFACHEPEYEATADPNHRTSGFSTQCEVCHGTSAWRPSTFDHDRQFFRIDSGRHAGRWDSCATCHTTPGNFGIFTCIDCHDHNRTEADSEHREVPHYLYESNACYACHRNV